MLGHIFGPETDWPQQDLIGFTDDLDARLAIAGYAAGVFPMPLNESGFRGVGWWSPLHRGIIWPTQLHISHSLRQSIKHYTTTIDLAFDQVIRRCGDSRRPDGWIDDGIVTTYTSLHRSGRVHSVETWDSDGQLVGGLYGVSMGALFAGESMFHDPASGRDASKVALVRLVETLLDRPDAGALLDVQWLTPHLASLGGSELPRRRYLDLLGAALDAPETDWPGTTSTPWSIDA